MIFTPPADEPGPTVYYISARSNSGGSMYHFSGTYKLSVTELPDGYEPLHTDDFAGDITTTGSVRVGGAATGEIEVIHGGQKDSDWFRMVLDANQRYDISVRGLRTIRLTNSFPVVDYELGTIRTGVGSIFDSDGNRIPNGPDNKKSEYGYHRAFRPYEDGIYYVQVRAGSMRDFHERALYGNDSQYGTYTVRLGKVGVHVDDYAADTSTTGEVTVGGSVTGEVERSGSLAVARADRDWFAVDLSAGQTYQIDLEGRATSGGSMHDPKIWGVFDANSDLVAGTIDDDGGVTYNSRFVFAPPATDVYYVSAASDDAVYPDVEDSYTGTYTLSVSLWHEDDYPADRSTTGELTVGGSVDGLIERSQDEDWFRVRLKTNKYYRFTVVGGQGADSLSAPTIGGLRDLVGTPVGSMGDYSGLNQEPTLVGFRADYDDIYYVTVRASGNETGSYTLAVTDVTAEIVAERFPLMVGTELVDNARLVGEVSADVSGAGLIVVNEPTIDAAHDVDWYRVTLDANVTYQIDMYGSSVGALDDSGIWHPAFTLFDPLLSGVYDAAGVLIPGSGDTTADGDAGDGKNSRFFVTPDGDGDYYIEATGVSAWTGTYGLNVVIVEAEPEPGLNNPATGAPAIDGTAQVGETLRADISGIADADGLANATFSYQWVADDGNSDTDIAGATDSTYTLVADDQGKIVNVRVSYTDDAGHEERVSSEYIGVVAVRPNSPPTGAPAITGTAQVGETLAADVSGIADVDGRSGVTFSYQWIANDGTSDTDITGATDSSYPLVAADEGKTIKVRVSFTDDAGYEETLTSTATKAVSFAVQQQIVNSPATGAPAITGTAQVGETLTADVSGIADADGLDNVTFIYEWIANDLEIQGVVASAYTLADADEGKTVKVRVRFTDDAGNEETLTSAATAAIEPEEPQEPPVQPQGLSGTVSHDAVSLTWDDPGDASIIEYQILRRNRAVDAPGQFQVHVEDTGSAAASYVDRDVEPDARYVYCIKARSAAGLSERSDYFRADTPPEPEPEPEPEPTVRPRVRPPSEARRRWGRR